MNPEYNFAFLDEGSKREIRRSILKAVAVPGYQVPFGSRGHIAAQIDKFLDIDSVDTIVAALIDNLQNITLHGHLAAAL